ncbi:MAG: hypothetical protein Fur0025_34090 [Oscillatoriaceae cyanobacterium]
MCVGPPRGAAPTAFSHGISLTVQYIGKDPIPPKKTGGNGKEGEDALKYQTRLVNN